MFFLSVVTTKSFGQEVPPFPTGNESLDTKIEEVVNQIGKFDTRMESIYIDLSAEQQAEVNAYFSESDETLFTSYSQFDDDELKESVSNIKTSFSELEIQFRELVPELDDNEAIDSLKVIVQSAYVTQRMAFISEFSDDCESIRRNCIGSVAAQSAIMHLGCVALDLTFFGGIICHGAAFAYQYFEGNICNANARTCRG